MTTANSVPVLMRLPLEILFELYDAVTQEFEEMKQVAADKGGEKDDG